MRATIGIVLVGLAVTVGGCASSAPAGGSLASAPPAAATAVSTASPSPAPSLESSTVPGTASPAAPSPSPSEEATMRPEPFTLTSGAFGQGEAIPRRYTCDGADASPELTWSGAPEGTQSLVLIVTDPDAHDFVHWLAYDLTGAPAGGLPTAIPASADAPGQGRNDFGKRGYGGPCPPSGTHHYRFSLSALDRVLKIPGTPRLRDLRTAMAGHVLAEVTLTATYRRS